MPTTKKSLFNKFISQFISIRFLLGAGVLVGFLCVYWQWIAYQQFIVSPINISDGQKILTVSRGDSISLLAHRWQQQGIITNQNYLKLLCYLNPDLKNIKAGEYQLNQQETPQSLLVKLSQGKVIQYSFTIIEGVNSYEVINSITNHNLLINDLNADSNELAYSLGIKYFSKSKNLHIEGWLFPDTYHYSRNESSTKLLTRAVDKMKVVLQQEWQNRAENLPYQSVYDALIMASIIEKETGLHSEREKIAGVFVRRLNKNMRLGTDPTVIYGIGPSFNGDITFKDLRTKTPYNTRIIKGLPPTPIAMPSRASIYAALHPDDSNALYFVADGSGGHYFSETLAEHNKAVRRYLNKN